MTGRRRAGGLARQGRLTGLSITAPQQVLVLTEKMDAQRPSFSLKDLTVTHRRLEAVGGDDGDKPR